MAKQKETKNDPFNFDSLTAIHDDIQDESSEVNTDAVAAHTAKELAAASEEHATTNSNGLAVDSTGATFDPEIHATDKDGNPSKTPKGKFRKKRQTAKSVIAQQSRELEALKEKQAADKKARDAATVAVTLSLHTAVMMLGEEWKADPDERVALDSAAGDYFVAKDINDFPPGIALSIVCFSFAAKRIATGKETQTKIGRAKYWVSEKWKALSKRKRKNASQSNSGDDGKRENDASEETVRAVETEGTRHPRT